MIVGLSQVFGIGGNENLDADHADVLDDL